MEADVRLDCGSAQMPIEDHLDRFQTHSLVGAVEQLG
jgi:hypothetical protein